MNWKYKMFINDIYWKGYAVTPTTQQKEIEERSFTRSEYYIAGSEIVVTIK